MERKNEGERSSLERVRSFLNALERGDATLEDAEDIRDDLYELVNRIQRVQERLPEGHRPELSSEVGELLQSIDNQKGMLQQFPFIKAASFL